MFRDGKWAVSFLLRTEVVSCTELRPIKQANIFRVQRMQVRSIFASRTIILPLHENIFTSFTQQSANLFSWEFTDARVRSGNRHNQRKQNKGHAFIQELVFKTQFHPCCNDNCFVAKDMLLRSLFGSCLQMKNLIFLLISLIYQNENKQRFFELPPFWFLACSQLCREKDVFEEFVLNSVDFPLISLTSGGWYEEKCVK